MQTYTLNAAARDLNTKPRDIRADRKITAECYGSGHPNQHLSLDYQEFRKVLQAAGTSSVIDLVVGADKPLKVLVQEVKFHPVTDEFQHVDFFAINMKKPVTTHIPVVFVGESPVVKSLGGLLQHGKTEILVKCLPSDLLHEISVDVSKLENPHDSIMVKDLVIDRTKIEVLEREDVLVVTALPPKTKEQMDAELEQPVGEAVSEDVKKEAEAEKAAAAASKESDTEKKGSKN